jgi:hypothetical protein
MTRPRRVKPSGIHERNAPRGARNWLLEAAADVHADLRAFAAKYSDRFEYVNGRLQQKRKDKHS